MMLTAAEMTSWARERLANYKVPRHWRFVPELPRNASGKVRKFLLREEAPRAGAASGRPGDELTS
jgi:acyl-coenzyme A synthetase/AMP-(fatty) acid ligase